MDSCQEKTFVHLHIMGETPLNQGASLLTIFTMRRIEMDSKILLSWLLTVDRSQGDKTPLNPW